MPGQARSHVVGSATASDGARTTAYRASVPLVCAQCTGAILPDHLFSRRSSRVTWATMGAVTTAPVCVTCRPLQVDGAAAAPAPTDEGNGRG